MRNHVYIKFLSTEKKFRKVKKIQKRNNKNIFQKISIFFQLF